MTLFSPREEIEHFVAKAKSGIEIGRLRSQLLSVECSYSPSVNMDRAPGFAGFGEN